MVLDSEKYPRGERLERNRLRVSIVQTVNQPVSQADAAIGKQPSRIVNRRFFPTNHGLRIKTLGVAVRIMVVVCVGLVEACPFGTAGVAVFVKFPFCIGRGVPAGVWETNTVDVSFGFFVRVRRIGRMGKLATPPASGLTAQGSIAWARLTDSAGKASNDRTGKEPSTLTVQRFACESVFVVRRFIHPTVCHFHRRRATAFGCE